MALHCLINFSMTMSKVPCLISLMRQRSMHIFTKLKPTIYTNDQVSTVHDVTTLPCANVLASGLAESRCSGQHRSLCTSSQHRKLCSLYNRNRIGTHTLRYGSSNETISGHMLSCDICVEQRRHAGHSKWSNIKHIKAAKDSQRASMTLKMMRNIRVAVREGGSADPKSNNQLARVIATAYDNDVPKTVVENTLKSAIKANAEASTVTFDCKGPGSFMMLIETFTRSANKARMEIYIVFKKHGGQMNDKPMGGHFFNYKGIVMVPPCEGLVNYEAAEEAAIMAEAEEVEETFDDEGNPVFQFICDPKAVHAVQKTLVEQNPEVSFNSPNFRYIPKDDLLISLSGPTLESAARLVDALEGLDEVTRVYTNIQAEDS